MNYIEKIVRVQKKFFYGNQTKSLPFRLMALDRLEASILRICINQRRSPTWRKSA